jgi:hypothetical protein
VYLQDYHVKVELSVWHLSSPFILLSDMGVERCVNLDGLTEAQIDKKLEELAKAG